MKLILTSLLALGVLSSCASIPPAVSDWRSTLNYQTVDNFQIAYQHYGKPSNPSVLMLHGLPTSSYLYRNIAPEIASLGYYVVVPDMLGFGASDKPKQFESYANEARSDRMQQLLKQLGINNFHLVAHDLGGPIGFELLSQIPNQVESMVILNTTAFEGFTPPKEMGMLAGWMGPMMSHMMRSPITGKTVTKKFLQDNSAETTQLTSNQLNNYWWPIHEGATRPMQQAAKTFEQFTARFETYQKAFTRYQQPVSLIWGELDPVLGQAGIAEKFITHLNIPEKSQTRLSHASHFLIEDDTQSVLAATLTHFETLAE